MPSRSKPGKPLGPKIASSRLPERSSPRHPAHEEWRLDEGIDETFPASDPVAPAQPHAPSRPRGDPRGGSQ